MQRDSTLQPNNLDEFEPGGPAVVPSGGAAIGVAGKCSFRHSSHAVTDNGQAVNLSTTLHSTKWNFFHCAKRISFPLE